LITFVMELEFQPLHPVLVVAKEPSDRAATPK
jgi:hypothetical protein